MIYINFFIKVLSSLLTGFLSINVRSLKVTNIKLNTKEFPYQSVDSGKFYKKIISKISKNKNVSFFKNLDEINLNKSIIFNSLIEDKMDQSKLWQHFQGIEIETSKDVFDDKIFNLMDFNCDQKNSVHFFYTLPFTSKKALVETTWLSNLNDKSLMDYDEQLRNYVENNLGIKNYQISYTEKGAIPLFYPSVKDGKKINIGSAGGMTRLSTGYTFLNIQEHCQYIRKNLENIENKKLFQINKKYQFLDKVFLKVLKNNPKRMPDIFFKMFEGSSSTIIKFLSNKSNFYEDFKVISKMPKWLFIKELVSQ